MKKRLFALLILCLCMGIAVPNAYAAKDDDSSSAISGAISSQSFGDNESNDLDDKFILEPEILPVMPLGSNDIIVNTSLVSRASNHIVTETPATLGAEGSWRYDGSDSPKQISSYKFALLKSDGSNILSDYIVYDYTPRTSPQFTYTLRQSGTYYLFCTANYMDGSSSNREYITFTVNNVSGVETVDTKISQIVAQCRTALGTNADEYDVAIWLHDWITHHAAYDKNYFHYGLDAILFYGTGACDSYSKLYKALLNKIGIDCERVLGTGNGGNHAWNVVKINGVWCQIDPTWDDPILAGTEIDPIVSGSEGYSYFGLTDELMKLNHVYEIVYPCTSMQNCYDLKNEKYRVWFYHIWDQFEDSLNSGKLHFDVSNNGRVMANTSGSYYKQASYVNRCSAVAVACMNELEWTMLTHPVDAVFSYRSSDQMVECSVNLGTPDMVLPGNTRVIEASAFSGDAKIATVEIKNKATSIGEEAFAGCTKLFWVKIPNSVTTIGSNVFKNLNKNSFMVVCNEGSKAEQYCKANGIVACTG